MVSKNFKPRKSLREAGIDSIKGEGVSIDNIKITVEHHIGDNKDPIEINIAKEWYGDVIENYRTEAERHGFNTSVILDLEREIGLDVVDMIDEIIKWQEKKTTEEIAAHQALDRNRQIVAAGTPEERIENQSQAAEALGDFRKPIPVTEAVHADPATIYTVYGQITAASKIEYMLKGGMYQCSRCNGMQYVQFERPSHFGDDEAPPVLHRMCRFCEEQNFQEGTREHQQATELRFVRPVHVISVKIELMDTETFDTVQTLPVRLFGKNAENVKIGEHVVVRGKHYALANARNRRIFQGVCYAFDIKYTNRAKYELTKEDMACVRNGARQFASEKDPKTGKVLGENNIIRRLVWMYGHHIPWYWDAKEALLYAETSAGPDMVGKGSNRYRRHRINVGLIGGAGLLKSSLARCVLLHDERNQYESAQGMTGKTMTAIVSKEGGDNSLPILRTGALAHTKEAALAVNEFAELSLDEQKHFQDAWEEGQFTINKMGVRATIRADSVGVWTGNPKQGASFSNLRKISIEEINVRKQILDRTDLLIVIKPIEDDQELKRFNDLLLEPETATPERKKIISNYDHYVKLHIMYARSIEPTLSLEAKHIINEADRRIQRQKRLDDIPNAGSHRGIGILLRLATVVAKLKLHQEITAEDANYAIGYYNKVSNDIQTSVATPPDPAQTAADIMLYILQNESNGLSKSYKELCELASAKDAAVRWYLYQGTKNKLGDVSTNRASRRVLELLENVGANKVKRVKMQPAEFLWIGKDDDEIKEEEQTSKEPLHADIPDVADKDKEGVQAKNEETMTDEGTKMAGHTDTIQSKLNLQGESQLSTTSATSAILHNKRLEEKEYHVLKACEMAMNHYKIAKAEGYESGALFTAQDAWHHLGTIYPNKEWDIKKVRKAIEEQVNRGRVLTRKGDPPDTYYLIWRDDGTNGGGVGEGDGSSH
jgi:DNA replicative helicase MCM subunit Mcm2 (Cdc46/Mcm family)